MIGDGLFYAQLSTVEDILKHAGVFNERQMHPRKDMAASFFRRKSYRQIYDECIREYAYDFKLVDQSLLSFVKGGNDEHNGSLSFSFYECPLTAISYEEFVASQVGVTPFDESYDTTIASWGDELREDYEQALTSSDSRIAVTPLRYDYKSSDYTPGLHPASHIHFGFENEIRVGTDRVLNPISFVLFVLRQRYPDGWRQLLKRREAPVWCRNVREDITIVHINYRSELDELELILR